MTHNPMRAANWRKTGRRRPPLDPHAGTKHSDIVRRGGAGSTLAASRQVTERGYMSLLMEGDGFSVSHEVLRAGTSIGFGKNVKGSRFIRVLAGSIFVTKGRPKEVCTVQQGGVFCAPPGTEYGFATSGTSEAEVLIVESPGYADDWEVAEASAVSQNAPQLIVAPSGEPSGRRPRNQSRAQDQAVQQASRRQRRGSSRPSVPTQTGSQRIGRNASANPNSGNIAGVNPMPMGVAGYKD